MSSCGDSLAHPRMAILCEDALGISLFAIYTRMIEFYGEGNITLLHDQPFMATVLGGFCMGTSAGLGLSCNATGGSDTVAAMINKFYNISLGHAILICDSVLFRAVILC